MGDESNEVNHECGRFASYRGGLFWPNFFNFVDDSPNHVVPRQGERGIHARVELKKLIVALHEGRGNGRNRRRPVPAISFWVGVATREDIGLKQFDSGNQLSVPVPMRLSRVQPMPYELQAGGA